METETQRQLEEPRRVFIANARRRLNPSGLKLIDADCAGHGLTQEEVERVNFATSSMIDAYCARVNAGRKCRTCNDTGFVTKMGWSYATYREACPHCPPQVLRAVGAL
jgi:hypothetical protein